MNYDFEVKLATVPHYFVPFFMSVTTASNVSAISIGDLLIDETINYRVRTLINGRIESDADFSPYYNISVLKASQAVVSGIIFDIIIIFLQVFDLPLRLIELFQKKKRKKMDIY